MAFDIHLGLRSGYGLNYTGTGRLINDGDGWNSWGEKPGTDANDRNTRHIIIRVNKLGEAIDAAIEIVNHDEGGLKAMDDGDLAVVTHSSDWSWLYLTINEEFGIRTHNGTVEE